MEREAVYETGEGSGEVDDFEPNREGIPDLIIIPREDLGPISAIPHFSIRNGDASDAKSIFVRATIPEAFHWVPVRGLEPKDSGKSVDAYIKSADYQLGVSTVPGLTEKTRRKAAIVLGVARAVATSFYDLEERDLTPGELAKPCLEATKGEDGKTKYKVARVLLPHASERISAELNLTEVEKAVVATLQMSSIGAIPMQGYSLVMSGHHYLSDANNQSRKVFSVVEKQFWKGAAVRDWFSEDLAFIQDLLWHKAGHPVSMSLKMSIATDPKVPSMLIKAGAGSAASRLPAQEPCVRAASAYTTLMATVHPLFASYGGYANYGVLTRAVGFVQQIPMGKKLSELDLERPEDAPNWITDREKALEWLDSMCKSNQDTVAFCYGFYCTMVDQSQTLSTGEGPGGDTLKTSFSLTKLRQASHASFVSGQQAYGDYVAARAKNRERGVFEAPKLVAG